MTWKKRKDQKRKREVKALLRGVFLQADKASSHDIALLFIIIFSLFFFFTISFSVKSIIALESHERMGRDIDSILQYTG